MLKSIETNVCVLCHQHVKASTPVLIIQSKWVLHLSCYKEKCPNLTLAELTRHIALEQAKKDAN